MPSSTYVALGSVTISSAQNQVTFSNIPQTYTDLILVSNVGASAINPSIYMRFNGDAQSNYSFTNIYGNGTAAASTRASTQSKAVMAWYVSPDTTMAMVNVTQIMNYSSNTVYKTTMSRANRGSASNSQGTEASISLWRNTAAINSITLLPEQNFSIGSTFNLYGISAKELKATGGDIIQTDGTYWYHAFKTSGTFTPLSTLSCDVLTIAGGGGGGTGGGANWGGGGGGAGGVFYATSQSIATARTVTIGAGGAGGSNSQGTNGSNTTFTSLTNAIGGGGGGRAADDAFKVGLAGGSGGGGAYLTGAGGATTQTGTGGTGYGFAGSTAASSYGSGGGGAGATGTGSGPGVNEAGTGGAGLNTWSSWLSPTGLGVSGFIAGGGGGGGFTNTGTGGTGGTGGGGKGSTETINNDTTGVANTGSGGGGSGNGYVASNGGSGLVIVRYAV